MPGRKIKRASLARRAIRLTAFLSSALVGVLASATTAAATVQWLPQLGVGSKTTTSCRFPDVCDTDVEMDAAGTTYLAAVNFDAANFRRVFVYIRPPGGSFGAPAVLSPASRNAINVDLDVDNQGNITVVWSVFESDTGTNQIQAAVAPAGQAFQPSQTLSNVNHNADVPAVQASNNGGAVVVWRNRVGANPSTMRQRTRTSITGGFDTASDIANSSSTTLGVPTFRMTPSGDGIATWSQFNGTRNIIEAAAKPAGAAWKAAETLSNTSQAGDSPDVAMTSNGRATAVWQWFDGTRTIVQTRERSITPNFSGGTWGITTTVTDTNEAGSSPKVAVDDDNNAVAIWAGAGNVVRAAQRVSGGFFFDHQPISGPGTTTISPRLAMSPQGDAVAIWAQAEGGTENVQSARKPKGSRFGGLEYVRRGISVPGEFVGIWFVPDISIAFDGAGNAAAAWFMYRQTNAGFDGNYLEVGRLDASPPTLSGIAGDTAGVTGQTLSFSVSPHDVWGNASTAWSFGDGASGSGDAVSHAYGAPGVYTVTATATDAAGNATSATRLVQVTNPPAPPTPPIVVPSSNPPVGRISITLGFAFSSSTNKQTKFTSMTVKGFPSGSTITVTCIKGTCPSSLVTKKKVKKKTKLVSKPLVIRNAKGTVKLSKVIKKALRAGTRIRVDATKAGMIGATKILVVGKRKAPKVTTQCLPVGSSKPQSSC